MVESGRVAVLAANVIKNEGCKRLQVAMQLHADMQRVAESACVSTLSKAFMNIKICT